MGGLEEDRGLDGWGKKEERLWLEEGEREVVVGGRRRRRGGSES